MAITGTIYGSTSNQYIDAKIEYSYTQDVEANTSTITATLYFRRNNTGYTTSGTGTFYVAIAGLSKPTTKYMNIGTGWADAGSVTNTVSHNADGTKSVSISASGSMPGTTLTATSCSGTVNLNTIPRASTITYAVNRNLGSNCIVSWTPLSKAFRYKLQFQLGGWLHTTEVIHPNITSQYDYTSYTLPLTVANQLSSAKKGTMQVVLFTYSDSAATTQIGSSSSKEFTVTVPDNSDTKPSITFTLSPSHSLSDTYSGIYIQGLSKVKATITTSGKYGATIKSCIMSVEGESFDAADSYTSNFLSLYGNKDVTITATDSRGISKSVTQSINVIAYRQPMVIPMDTEKDIICERCDKDGNITSSGTYLKIKVQRSYSKVISGDQKNFCAIVYRYKTSTGTYSEWETLLAKDDLSTNSVDSSPLLNGSLAVDTSYRVQIGVQDDIGNVGYTLFLIPTDSIQSHEGEGFLSLGKYSEKGGFECEWDAEFYHKLVARNLSLSEQDITVGGNLDTYYPVHIKPIVASMANSQPSFLGVGKMLGTTFPAWEGNHSTSGSSLAMGWLYRYSGWDGSGAYITPLYRAEPYAKLLSHISGQTGAARGVVLYLRGGGATYKITSSIPCEIDVYLEETNISDYSSSPANVSPRTDIGNGGVTISNGIMKDFIVEQGTSGIWAYRKWASGIAECWGVTDSITQTTSLNWNVLTSNTASTKYDYPFNFVNPPIVSTDVWNKNANVWLITMDSGTATKTPAYQIARGGTSAATVTFKLSFHAIGNWK